MTLQITFRRPARAELIEAAAWYEAQRPNLGAEFIAARRFPYGIYFRAEARRIVVLAVFHSRRDPEIWRGRE
jgi:toxin ParE1/3/4